MICECGRPSRAKHRGLTECDACRMKRIRQDPKHAKENRLRVRIWQEANPEKRLIQRLRVYGLSLDKFEALVKTQKGLCAVCGKAPNRKRLDIFGGNMRLGIDIDGVLADFVTAYKARFVQLTGRDLFGDSLWASWSHEITVGYTKDEVTAIWEAIKSDPLFWVKLSPYWDALTVLERLTFRHYHDDVYFITARPGIEVKKQTELWLSTHSPFFDETPTVLISSEKGMCCRALRLEKYIDDRPENVADVRRLSPDTKTYLMDRTWNQGEHGQHPCLLRGDIKRVESVEEMLDDGV